MILGSKTAVLGQKLAILGSLASPSIVLLDLAGFTYSSTYQATAVYSSTYQATFTYTAEFD